MSQIKQQPSYSKREKNNFLKKVYVIIDMQLLVIVLLVFCHFYFKEFAEFQANNTSVFICIEAVAFSSFFLLNKTDISMDYPANYILFIAFIFGEAYLVSYACIEFASESVLLIVIGILSSSLLLTYQVKMSNRSCKIQAIQLVFSLIYTAIILVLIHFVFLKGILQDLVLAFLSATIYSVYISYTTISIMQEMIQKLTLDNHIFGAISFQFYIKEIIQDHSDKISKLFREKDKV